MRSYTVRKIGENRGSKRIYIDSHGITQGGFLPGMTYNRVVDTLNKRITLNVDPDGCYVVSKKVESGRVLPIIDIRNNDVLGVFNGLEVVRIVVTDNVIYILPLASDVKRHERLTKLKSNLDSKFLTTAGISFGAGILDHALHAGLKDSGIDSQLLLANEIDEGYLNHAIAHNDVWNTDTIGIAAPMQELCADESAMRRLPRVDVLAAGIPCSGASRAGKSKRKLAMMEDHPSVGHLVASAIMLINRMNPAVVIIENVMAYSETASAQILRHHLAGNGYQVSEVVLSSQDFGTLENRVRWFLVAATNGIQINLDDLAPKLRAVRKVGDVLEDIEPDSESWRDFDYLKVKQVRDQEKGNGFGMQVITPDSTSCPVLRKGYAKGGSTDPLLQHPTDPNLLRQLTVIEHARIKEVPEHLISGMSNTDGHAVLGQGIAYVPVRALFQRIGSCLMSWRNEFIRPSFDHDKTTDRLVVTG